MDNEFDSENFMDEVRCCAKCSSIISHGTQYYSIVKNLERVTDESDPELPSIEVDESIEVIVLCVNCGVCFDEENLEVIVKAIPVRGKENRN